MITAEGTRVGQITASVQRPNAPDDLVIYFEDRGFDMTTAPADVQALRDPARDVPVVVGGGTVVIREQNLIRLAGGDALVIAPDALAALATWGLAAALPSRSAR